MRISTSFTSVSVLFIGVVTVAVSACDPSRDGTCTRYDGCYPSYGQSGTHGGPPPEATPTLPCKSAFSVAFVVPEESGDCQLTLRRKADAYESDSDTASYYFAQPRAQSDAEVPCEALDGPLVGRCTRQRGLVVFASVRESDAVNVRSALGLSESATSFSAELSCARIATPIRKTVSFRCGGSTPASPKRGDAGTSDAGVDADDGGDAAADATASEQLH